MAYTQNTFLYVGVACTIGIAFLKVYESLSNDTPTKPKKNKPIGGTRKSRRK